MSLELFQTRIKKSLTVFPNGRTFGQCNPRNVNYRARGMFPVLCYSVLSSIFHILYKSLDSGPKRLVLTVPFIRQGYSKDGFNINIHIDRGNSNSMDLTIGGSIFVASGYENRLLDLWSESLHLFA